MTGQYDGPVGGVKWPKLKSNYVSGQTNIHPVLMHRLDALARDYGKKIQITDGGRSYAQQKDVKRRKPYLAAKPGTSNHEIGTAADIASQWVRNLSNDELKKYGLYKSALSKGETWHVDLIENDGRSNKDTIAYLGGVKGGSGGGGVGSKAGSASYGSGSISGSGTGYARKQVPSSINSIVNRASSKYKVNPNLVAAVIKAESAFQNNRRSHAGAGGYMQLMPATARGLGVSNVMNPQQNIEGGTKYLRQMLERYDGNVQLALVGYNWGPGNADKVKRRYGTNWNNIKNHVPKETRDYVTKIMQWR